VIYIETGRDLLYDSLYVIYNSFVYELVEKYIFTVPNFTEKNPPDKRTATSINLYYEF
jgi:hypothetical protein